MTYQLTIPTLIIEGQPATLVISLTGGVATVDDTVAIKKIIGGVATNIGNCVICAGNWVGVLDYTPGPEAVGENVSGLETVSMSSEITDPALTFETITVQAAPPSGRTNGVAANFGCK